MSGLYIPGMEMPTRCYNCKIDCGLVSHIDRNIHPFWRSEDCPLVPVPEHGRLGDLDAAVEKLKRLREFHADDSRSAPFIVAGINQCIDILSGREAPTIIPADKEGEG